nr:uncharacterized protein LOC100665465 isoform X4 [Loxodonta africana]
MNPECLWVNAASGQSKKHGEDQCCSVSLGLGDRAWPRASLVLPSPLPVPPAVNVTLSQAMKGKVTLTHWAAGFYSQKITLTRLQDGEPLSKGSQESGSVLSSGNGTYVIWVSTSLPQGEEQRYSCHVEDSGKNMTHPVSHGRRKHQMRKAQNTSSYKTYTYTRRQGQTTMALCTWALSLCCQPLTALVQGGEHGVFSLIFAYGALEA